MTRGQLLASADSKELTLWQLYLEADAEEREFQRKVAEDRAKAKSWANGEDALG